MKLHDYHCSRPVNHTVVPNAPQGFTVGVRGVKAIETCPDGVLVTLIPGDGDERSAKAKPVTLLIREPGAGVVEK